MQVEVLDKIVEEGFVSREVADEAVALLKEGSVDFRSEDDAVVAELDGKRQVIVKRQYACTCSSRNGSGLCGHLLALGIAADKFKEVLSGREFPGGYRGWLLFKDGVVSLSVLKGAVEAISSGQVEVKRDDETGAYLGEFITDSGRKTFTRLTDKEAACSSCSRFCRHIVAMLLLVDDDALFERVLRGEIELGEYYAEEEVEISGRVLRLSRKTGGIMLDYDDGVWVNGYVPDVQIGDELKLLVRQKGNSRQVIEVLEHKKEGEPVEAKQEERASEQKAGSASVYQPVVDSDVRNVLIPKAVELFDKLDEEMMRLKDTAVVGMIPLVYEVPTWRCPKCGVHRAKPRCKKCKTDIPHNEYYPMKQLTWEGVREAVRLQGNLHVVRLGIEQTVVEINGRRRTYVWGVCEVLDVERNVKFVGTSEKADPTKSFYTTILMSKAERNALRLALKKVYVNKVLEVAESIPGAVYRADPQSFLIE